MRQAVIEMARVDCSLTSRTLYCYGAYQKQVSSNNLKLLQNEETLRGVADCLIHIPKELQESFNTSLEVSFLIPYLRKCELGFITLANLYNESS